MNKIPEIGIRFQKLKLCFKNWSTTLEIGMTLRRLEQNSKIRIKFQKLAYNSKNWNKIPKNEIKFQKLEHNLQN